MLYKFEKGFISEYINNLYVSVGKDKSVILNDQKDLNRHFAKEGAQKIRKPMKRCPDQLPTAAVAGNYHKPGDLAPTLIYYLAVPEKPGVHNRPLRAKAEIYSGLHSFFRF